MDSSEEPPNPDPQLQLTSALGLRGDALAFLPNLAGFECVRGQGCALGPGTQQGAWNRVGGIQKVLKGLRSEVRAEKPSLVQVPFQLRGPDSSVPSPHWMPHRGVFSPLSI